MRVEVKRIPHPLKPGCYTWKPSCSGPQCEQKPVYLATYEFWIGHRARATTRFQLLCREHGVSFAATHNVHLPVVI